MGMASGVFELNYGGKTLNLEEIKDYRLIEYGDLALMGEAGRPFLPVDNVLIAISSDQEPLGIEILRIEAETLRNVTPPPAPPPAPLVKKPDPFPEPDPLVYGGTGSYPTRLVEIAGTGHLFGQKVALLRVNVGRYLPADRSVVLLKALRFRLKSRKARDDGSRCRNADLVRKVVLNPEDVRVFAKDGELEYVVITSESLSDEFEPLVRWKRQKGIRAEIRTVEWISSNYSGRDLQEKIRNYLKSAADSGLVWVLLGGDVSVVPHRIAFAMNSGANIFSDEDSIPCDLYYSDLDGTWDYNNNDVFGEVGDSVDLLPDVIVGRAPVETGSEASLFVDKVLHYEVESPDGYLNRALFAGEYLDEETDGSLAKDFVVSELPDGVQVCKLYERFNNLDAASFIDSINSGFNLVNHNGHGSIQVLCTGPDAIYPEDFQNLSNFPKLVGLFYSIGCWTAAFDYEDCMAEFFVLAQEGGGFYVGNSRYGWYTQYFPGYGSSDIFDRRFFGFLKSSTHRAGVALALVKAFMAPASRVENDFRWNEYTLTYFGDPEMPLYFADPESLRLEVAGNLNSGLVDIPVVLEAGEVPVPAGLAGLSDGQELLTSGYSDEAGFVLLHADLTGLDSVLLVGSKPGLRPVSRWVSVMEGPYVAVDTFYVSDENGDGYLAPGEAGTLHLSVVNEGNSDLYSLVAYLAPTDSLISVSDTDFAVGDLPQGATAGAEFPVVASQDLRDGVPTRLVLRLVSSGGNSVHSISLCGGEGVLGLEEVREDNAPPGDTAALRLVVANRGHGRSNSSSVVIGTEDPYLSPTFDSLYVGVLEPGGEAHVAFELLSDPGCPQGHIAPVTVRLISDTRTEEDTIYFMVGWSGFHDDVENENVGWTVEGELWHITEHRASSGSHSWYCGEEGSYTYPTNAHESLITPELVLPPDPIFRFKTWYETFAGWDYCVLELRKGEERYPLDLMMGSSDGFEEREYDLSFLNPGDTVQVCFTFVSYDYDMGYEGWYVDDVELTSRYLSAEESLPPREDVRLTVSPNPSRGDFLFALPGFAGKEVDLRIYDATGRLVRELVSRVGSVLWDGSDLNGRKVRSGIYFYRLRAGNRVFRGRLLLLRG